MYLRSLWLSNLRCFKQAELTFQYPGRDDHEGNPPTLPNVNLLLGSNGAGKTTILRGAAMALLAPALSSSGFRPYALVRRTFDTGAGRPPQFAEVEAKVLLSHQDAPKRKNSMKEKLVVRLSRREDQDTIQADETTSSNEMWDGMFRDKSPAFLVLGYGATRRIGQPEEDIGARNKKVQLRFQRVQSLFEEGVSLIPLGWSLPRITNAGRKRQIIKLVDQLIGDFYTFEGHIEGEELYFKRKNDGAHVPMGALSDGFRAFISWVGDMLYHIFTGCPSGKKLTENEGVVLVDEIDLHLHPEWQQRVIQTLSVTFPKIQFIFTSHSPLVTASLEAANVWVMREPQPIQLDDAIYGLSADQVLQSPYFALDSARPPEVADKLRALDQKAQTGDRDAAVEFMQRLAYGSEKQPAITPRKANSKKRISGKGKVKKQTLPEL